MKATLPILGGLLLTAVPAFAAEPGPTPSATPGAPEAVDDKLICRRQVVVGSRLPGPKVCRTRAQWDGNNRDDQDAIRRVQDLRRSPDGG
ncbi:hypothetical protein WG901_03995 [Novosphingobium sp. PS1R-30]|uniref:Uncharacterized protein n=1 Tax=Novosphingobium anseongense TaxID=3133436 RepID=A0ABU8RRZ6_9SPHN